MLTLFIVVGVYFIQCVGSSCYSVSKEVVDVLLTAGLLETIYEVPKIVTIYRKKGR